jgi:site-specific recombinase XerD
MPRVSRGPVYYPSKNAYFANFDGERIKLVEGNERATKKEAWRKYDQLAKLRRHDTDGDKAESWTHLNAYLEDASTRTVPPPLAPDTYRIHQSFIQSFVNSCGRKKVRDLTAKDFNEWISYQKKTRLHPLGHEVQWSDGNSSFALRVLKTAFDWAAAQKLISISPFERNNIEVPHAPMEITRLAVTEEEHKELITRARKRPKGNYAELLELLYHTGCRPSEMVLAEAKEWDEALQAFVIDPKDPATVGRLKTRRHLLRQGRKRIIRVPDYLVDMVRQLCKQRPHGSLFTNERGKTWDKQTVAFKIHRLVKSSKGKVRKGISLYSYRHAYVTRWLEEGHSPTFLCELINTSLVMLQKRYSHLFERHDALLTALNKFGKPTS